MTCDTATRSPMPTTRTPDPSTLLHDLPGLPGWMSLSGVSLAAGCMLAGLGMLAYAIVEAAAGAGFAELGGVYGSALGCLIGGGGALFGVLRDRHRRLPATALLFHVQNDRPIPLYRIVFFPALTVFVIVAGFALSFDDLPLFGLLQTSGMLAFLGGTLEAARRHTTRQARDVFACYAAGSLDPANTAAIDEARRLDEAFDAGLREHLDGYSSENSSSAAPRGSGDSA